jgi:sensor histidine kinase regulating citrate/malate metabolism
MAIEEESARRQMAAVLDGIEGAIVVVDAGGAIVLQNAAYVERFPDDGHLADILDTAGNRIPPSLTPLERAARGEQFTLTFAQDIVGERLWFVANGRPVDAANRHRLGIVTIRETPAPGDRDSPAEQEQGRAS